MEIAPFTVGGWYILISLEKLWVLSELTHLLIKKNMTDFSLPFTSNSLRRRTTNKISTLTNKGIYQIGNYFAFCGI